MGGESNTSDGRWGLFMIAKNPLQIGHVIGVNGDQVDVAVRCAELAVQHGDKTYRVGQVGTYVTLPRAERTLIGYVISVRQSESPGGVADSSATPEVALACQLIGTVVNGRFSRGVNDYPIPNDSVLLAVDHDFSAIFGTQDE